MVQVLWEYDGALWGGVSERGVREWDEDGRGGGADGDEDGGGGEGGGGGGGGWGGGCGSGVCGVVGVRGESVRVFGRIWAVWVVLGVFREVALVFWSVAVEFC